MTFCNLLKKRTINLNYVLSYEQKTKSFSERGVLREFINDKMRLGIPEEKDKAKGKNMVRLLSSA